MSSIQTRLQETLRFDARFAYAVITAELTLAQVSPNLAQLLGEPEPLTGRGAAEVFWELEGGEDALRALFTGERADYQLERVNRTRLAEETFYLNLYIVPLQADQPLAGLLLAVEDVTVSVSLERQMMQERNEVSIAHTELKRLNAALAHEITVRQAAEAAVRESEARLDYLLRHFVPNVIVEHLKARGELPQPGGEQRTVTVLFADIRGYSTIAERRDPVAVLAALNQHFDLISSIIVARGGVINQFVGDMVMAIFNALGDQPDHARCAVQAGLELQAAIEAARERLAENVVMGFGVGLNTGPAVVGFLGFKDRFDFTAIGDTTNVAFRLCSKAEAGQVLLTARAHEAAGLDARLLGEMALKNRTEPVMVYEALATNKV